VYPNKARGYHHLPGYVHDLNTQASHLTTTNTPTNPHIPMCAAPSHFSLHECGGDVSRWLSIRRAYMLDILAQSRNATSAAVAAVTSSVLSPSTAEISALPQSGEASSPGLSEMTLEGARRDCPPTNQQQLDGISQPPQLTWPVKVELVLGNTGADLDSSMSALAFALYRDELKVTEASICVPVINTPRADFVRAEVAYVFEKAGISLDQLVFQDDVAWEQRLGFVHSVVLVDHNAPPASELVMIDNLPVTAIIDHHVDMGMYLNANPRVVVVPTGSTASLLINHMESLKGSNAYLAGQFMGRALRACNAETDDVKWSVGDLLASVILWDTGNLGQVASKLTRRDLIAIAQLGLGSWLHNTPAKLLAAVPSDNSIATFPENFDNGLAEGHDEASEKRLLQAALQQASADGEASRTSLFKIITKKTVSIDHLTTKQKLKMDLKMIHCRLPGSEAYAISTKEEEPFGASPRPAGYLHIAVASVPISLVQWIEGDPDFIRAVDEFLVEMRADALVILTLIVGSDSLYARDLLVYSPSEAVAKEVLHPLLWTTDKCLTKSVLELSPLPLLSETPEGQGISEHREAVRLALGEEVACFPDSERHRATRNTISPYVRSGMLSLFALNNISQSRKQLIPILEAGVASMIKE